MAASKTIIEYLKDVKEPLPHWLAVHRPGQHIDFNEAFQSRILYYPGAGTDGTPMKLFNQAEYCHLHIYVDYGVKHNQILNETCKKGAIPGYSLLDYQELSPADLVPNGWTPHLNANQNPPFPSFAENGDVFGLIAIFQRGEEGIGCDRFALIYLGGDGIATYDALFLNTLHRAPDVLVLQDHGFGGNYDCFGKGGLLDELGHVIPSPKYMLIGDNTLPWEDYDRLGDVLPSYSGIYLRYLHARKGLSIMG